MDTQESDPPRSVLEYHTWQNTANSAAYLLDSIRSDVQIPSILDVGFGLGTITIDFAAMVLNERVVGVDMRSDVPDQAQSLANERALKQWTLDVGDANKLNVSDNTFDVYSCTIGLTTCSSSFSCFARDALGHKPVVITASGGGELSRISFCPEI